MTIDAHQAMITNAMEPGNVGVFSALEWPDLPKITTITTIKPNLKVIVKSIIQMAHINAMEVEHVIQVDCVLAQRDDCSINKYQSLKP